MNDNLPIVSNYTQLKSRRFIFTAVLVLLSCNTTWASLLIMPNRVVIEGEKKSASIILANTSTNKKSYDVIWKQQRLMPDGRFMELSSDSNEVGNASRFLRFSPNKITLLPGKKQTIRILARRKIKLSSRELRSHLTLQTISDIDSYDAPYNIGPPVQSRFENSYSIPVIVRQGKLDTNAQITSMLFRKLSSEKQNNYYVRLTLNGTGRNTSTGRIVVSWKRRAQAGYQIIGNLPGISLYPESASVYFLIKLNLENEPRGFIKVAYEGTNEFTGQVFDVVERTVQSHEFREPTIE